MADNGNTVNLEMANVIREVIHEKSYTSTTLPIKRNAIIDYEIGSFVYLQNQYSFDGKTLPEGTYQLLNIGADESIDCWVRIINEKGELILDNGSIKIDDHVDENSDNLVTNRAVYASINGLQIQINNDRNTLESHQKTLDSHRDSISSMNSKLTNHETRIKTSESEITTLKGRASNIEEVNRTQGAQLEQHATDISKAQSDISNNASAISTNASSIRENASKIATLTQTVSDNNTSVTNSINDVNTKSVKYVDIVGDTTGGASKVLSADAGKKIRTDVNAHGQRLTSVEQTNNSQGQTLSQHAESITQLGVVDAGLRKDVDRVDRDALRAKDAETQISSIDGNVVKDSVRVTSQTFNEEQKRIARLNIGTLSKQEIIALIREELKK